MPGITLADKLYFCETTYKDQKSDIEGFVLNILVGEIGMHSYFIPRISQLHFSTWLTFIFVLSVPPV